jgi:hypothetical protein
LPNATCWCRIACWSGTLDPVELSVGEILLASGVVSGGLLPPDTVAWLRW